MVTVMERKKEIKNITLRISSRRNGKKREFLSIHDRFIRDALFRKTMIELGRTAEVIREMDKLANEDHTHIATGRTQRIPWQLVDTFEFCWFRHDAHKA